MGLHRAYVVFRGGQLILRIHGGDPDDEGFRELLVRWFQYGTFSPVMRLHGDKNHKQNYMVKMDAQLFTGGKTRFGVLGKSP